MGGQAQAAAALLCPEVFSTSASQRETWATCLQAADATYCKMLKAAALFCMQCGGMLPYQWHCRPVQ